MLEQKEKLRLIEEERRKKMSLLKKNKLKKKIEFSQLQPLVNKNEEIEGENVD